MNINVNSAVTKQACFLSRAMGGTIDIQLLNGLYEIASRYDFRCRLKVPILISSELFSMTTF